MIAQLALSNTLCIRKFFIFKNLRDEARFLSVTVRPFLEDLRSQFYLGIRTDSPGVDIDWSDKNSFFSARCIKDD